MADEAGLERVEFDDLLREVLTRVHGVLDEQDRQRLLLDAVVTMAADLSLDGVLARIVTIASNLVDAQYAALGVLDVRRDRLRTFIHHGMTDDQVAEIGELPSGHGLLGLIIDQPEPLRLSDLTAHPASYGIPPGHPPMSSFLGVPVRIRDRVFGNLYLTEKAGGVDFTEQDESIVIALAAAAGVTIENARLYEEAAQRQEWLSATAEIAAVLADPASGQNGSADRGRPGSLRGRRRPGVDRRRAGTRRAWSSRWCRASTRISTRSTGCRCSSPCRRGWCAARRLSRSAT